MLIQTEPHGIPKLQPMFLQTTKARDKTPGVSLIISSTPGEFLILRSQMHMIIKINEFWFQNDRH